MNIPQSTGDWQPGHPADNSVVEVWYLVSPILAYWDGKEWRSADDNRQLGHISRWRTRRF